MNAVPDGAWDCHAHVIEDPHRFPLALGRAYEPPLASLASYLGLLDRLGFAHGVLVQPSVYGFDNRCMIDALDRADHRLYGIAVPSPDSTTRQLEDMHRRGVRGVRCNLLYAEGLSIDTARMWNPVLKALGWHIELHANADVINVGEVLDQFDVPVIFDHMGRLRPPIATRQGPGAPEREPAESHHASHDLIEAVRQGACWVKLAAPYRLSSLTAPWPDVTPLAHALAAANPARCLWASDWPHTDTASPVTMDQLLASLADWLPELQVRHQILTASPRPLFTPP